MAATVLILSDEGSLTVESVCEAVRRFGGQPKVICPASLATGGGITLGWENAAVWGSDGTAVDPLSCSGIWSWHPNPIRAPDVNDQHRRYVEQEWRLAIASLQAITKKQIWINHPAISSLLDGNRIAQYNLAISAGLLVPPTLVTNDPSVIREAIGKWDVVALKSLGGVAVRNEDGSYETAFTQRCTASDLEGYDDALRRAPLVVQPYLEKQWEVRVTIIDDVIFSCRIDSQSDTRTQIDWRRYAVPHVRHQLISLPTDVDNSIRSLMKRSGLRYAAIDLLVTPKGETYFLDLNPSGQFGWIEGLTGAPITEQLARALVSSTR